MTADAQATLLRCIDAIRIGLPALPEIRRRQMIAELIELVDDVGDPAERFDFLTFMLSDSPGWTRGKG